MIKIISRVLKILHFCEKEDTILTFITILTMESICTHTLIGSNAINTECSILARLRRTFVGIYNGSSKLSYMYKTTFYYIVCLSNTNQKFILFLRKLHTHTITHLLDLLLDQLNFKSLSNLCMNLIKSRIYLIVIKNG